MLDMRDTGKVECRTGGMQDWRNARKEECRKGEIQEMRDANLVLPSHYLKNDNNFNLRIYGNVLTCYAIIFHVNCFLVIPF